MDPESTAVVPAHRLLEVAQLLADGAARLHAELQELPPDRRQVVLDAVATQVGDIVRAWSHLVQAVVSVESAPAPLGHPHRPIAAPGGVASNLDEQIATALDEALDRPLDEALDGPIEESIDAPPRAAVEAQPATAPGPHTVRGPFSAAPRQWRRTERAAAEPGTARDPAPVSSAAAEGTRLRPLAPAQSEDRKSMPPRRDELTGVLDRQSGLAAIQSEMSRCRRDGVHLVLGYLNVDAMREVNEARGPHGGDELLRKVAAALRATLRSYDVIMRLAGDEFLFSLPGADVTTAEKRIKEFGIILGEEAPGASVSVGFAELQPEDTVEDMIARADDALVQARRRRGRRRLR